MARWRKSLGSKKGQDSWLALIVFLLIALFAAASRAHTARGHALPNNCLVQIVLTKRSGEKIRVDIKTHLDSRVQCERLAGFHRPNFEPDTYPSKRVSFRWLRNVIAFRRR